MANIMSFAGQRLRPLLRKRSREGLELLHNGSESLHRSFCCSAVPRSGEFHRRHAKLQTSFPAFKCMSWPGHEAHISRPRRYSSQMGLSERIPPNSWDSHMHVVDPDNYPIAADAPYTPAPHTLSHAMSFYSTIGISRMVFVQPSIYANDNSCMLDALRAVGPRRARAVVAFDPARTPAATLREWHALGVRGARLNLQSLGRAMPADELAAALRRYADALRPLRWVLQLYVPLRMVAGLESVVPDLGVCVCLDHFGSPALPVPREGDLYTASRDPYTLPGFRSLVNLLRQGSTYVKLSAPYRISRQEGRQDLEPLARELLRVAGKRRLVFATDWPHTRFAGLDIRPFIERVLEWCGDDEELVERLFRGNAEELWDVKT